MAIEARQQLPRLPVVVLSQYVEHLYARELLGDGRGGIGYLLKDRISDVDEFLDALDRVVAGGTALDPEVVSAMLGKRRRRLDALTHRERAVLALMAEGLTNAAIAGRLYLSEKSVDKHIGSLFRKLCLAESPELNRRVLAVLAYLDI